MNKVFHYKRLGHLLRNEALSNLRSFLIISAIVVSVPIILAVFNMILGSTAFSFGSREYFFVILTVWSLLLAGIGLSDIHNKQKNTDFFLLPASALEKLLAKILLIAIGLPILIMLLITVIWFLESTIDFLRFSEPFAPLNFRGIVEHVWTIIVWQSVFLLGSAWFKRWHILKTLLSLSLFSLLIAILAFIIFVLFARLPDGVALYETGLQIFFSPYRDFGQLATSHGGLIKTIYVTTRIMLFGLIAPFCWFVSYLRIKDVEISDGI